MVQMATNVVLDGPEESGNAVLVDVDVHSPDYHSREDAGYLHRMDPDDNRSVDPGINSNNRRGRPIRNSSQINIGGQQQSQYDDVDHRFSIQSPSSLNPSRRTRSLTIKLPSKNEKLLPDLEEASTVPSGLAVVCKWLVLVLIFLAFLGCIVYSKVSVIHMTSTLKDLKSVQKCSVFLMLLICVMIPYGLTLIRSVYCGGTRKDRPWPSKKALVWGLMAAVSESAGITLFTLDVLPSSTGYVGVLLMNGVFFIPIILQIVFSARRHRRGIRSESRLATGVLVTAAIFSLCGLCLTATFAIKDKSFPNEKLWEIPVSIVLLSFAWCPLIQKLQLDPSEAKLKELIDRNETVNYEVVNDIPSDPDIQPGSSSTATTYSSASSTSNVSTDTTWSPRTDLEATVIVNKDKDPDELPLAWAHPQFSARWKISIITSSVKLLLIPGFGLLFGHYLDIVVVTDLHKGFDIIGVGNNSFVCFIISIFTNFGAYLLGWGACVMGISRIGFAFPLLLGTPLTVAVIMIPATCKFLFKHSIETADSICQENQDHSIILPAAACLYISQLLSVGYFLLKTITIVMPKESQIFWLPGYNGIFLEQHLLLSRKNKQTDAAYVDPRAKATKTKVFICTTMYREEAREMEQLLKSYARVNRAKQESDRNFEAHIFLDNGVRGKRLTPFALQLVSLVKKCLDVCIEDCTKMLTPYGMRLSWNLPSVEASSGMPFSIHLKDNRKVKNKKRWSQIMYMSYTMDYLIRQDRRGSDENSFILTTDADVKFTPGSVEALLDLMTRDESVGAVCSRTHPMGSGPIYWYQIFDYAIGHWLQKVANHVLGSVLCCPGCFSVYRVKALRDVVSMYASSVTKAQEFLTKDMGEDRWLCTLMVQAGWRLDYCAAAENSTYCPEEFDEYFKQRRRWIPSSLANQVLLLQEWKQIFYFNKQISMLFIVYQGILLISALLNPSMLFIIIIGGLNYSLDVSMVASTVCMMIVTVGYAWICLTFSQEFQLKVAKVLTILFSLVMAAVAIGLVVQLVQELTPEPESTTFSPTPTPHHSTTTHNKSHKPDEMSGDIDVQHLWMDQHIDFVEHTTQPVMESDVTNEDTRNVFFGSGVNKGGKPTVAPHNSTEEPPFDFPLSVTSIYLYGLLSIFLITALLHPDEAYCLIHGIWYLFCLPSGNLILMIYSLCNLTDRSWGTREEKKITGFGEVTDWKQSIKKFFQKLCFLCTKRNDESRETSNETTNETPKEGETNPTGPSTLKVPDTAKKAADTEQTESKLHKYSKLKRLERNTSFKFHDNGVEKGPIQVANWLPSNLKGYSSLFIENGYDDTSFIVGMSERDVIDIGIDLKVHISAVMAEIKKLPDLEIEPCVPEDADSWLESIGLVMYRLNFRRSHIVTRDHLELLRAMSKQDIISELGITKSGHLRRLKIAIENLRYPTDAERDAFEVKFQIEELLTHELKEVNQDEHEFWTQLREERLLPESVAFAHDLDLKEKLTELRNSVLMGFGVSNAIFLILVLILFTKSVLNIRNSNALGSACAILFGTVLAVQFISMLVHRLSTWMHMIARAPIRCGDPYNVTWAWSNKKMVRVRTMSGENSDGQGSLEASDEAEAETQREIGVRAARDRNKPKRPMLSPIDERAGDDAPLIRPM